MQQATMGLDPLIHFHGLNFSHEHVECPHCSWGGEAGSLLAPIAKVAAGQLSAYSCPQCHESIATHDGFSKEEIREELHAIRDLIGEVRAIRTLKR
jgi:hypothetical protein